MIWTKNNHLFAATLCQRTGKPCPALARMAEQLTLAMQAARPVTRAEFEIEGTGELSYCGTACRVAYRAKHGCIRLFSGAADAPALDQLDQFADALMRPDGRGFPAAGQKPPRAIVEARPQTAATPSAELRA